MTKLYILTGFLGAGKTSLLTHLLDNLQGIRIGVIQNEFGKISIDGILSRRDGIEMVEINRGSVFCSCLKLSFVKALAEMGQKNLDMVIVESSGLADPSNMDEILKATDTVAGRKVYNFMGAICMVDAVNFQTQMKDAETVYRQLAHCHVAVINKTDMVTPEKIQSLIQCVRAINPVCRIETAVMGRIPPMLLTQNLSHSGWAPCEKSLNTVDTKPKTISLQCHEPVSLESLSSFLTALAPDCYRIKGFFQLYEGWVQVDVVESLIDFKPAQAQELSQLILLSKIGPQVIRSADRAWKSHVTAPMELKN